MLRKATCPHKTGRVRKRAQGDLSPEQSLKLGRIDLDTTRILSNSWGEVTGLSLFEGNH